MKRPRPSLPRRSHRARPVVVLERPLHDDPEARARAVAVIIELLDDAEREPVG